MFLQVKQRYRNYSAAVVFIVVLVLFNRTEFF